ncbi:MAG: N-acetyl-gamma-glutamyl-phosphate reductase [Christensenellaceae bacterium]
MIDVSIIGATGYVGAELLRLLESHPNVHIEKAISKNFAGQNLSEVYSNFIGKEPQTLSDLGEIPSEFVFLCLPHGASIKLVPDLLASGKKVIDLSGDFRYENTATYEKWYNLPHTAKKENAQAVYGLPEFFKSDICKTKITANPGCYTTTSILALAPLLSAGLIKKDGIIIDAKSGVTGAGRQEKLAYSYCETDGNFKAYSLTNHRHTSEIEEQLSRLSMQEITLLFTPHLLPVKRGILATIYADIAPDVTAQSIQAAYAKAYQNEPFVHVLQSGKVPELKQVVGSNNCVIGFDISLRTGKVILVACIDNLIKGAAGQAIQNFNLMNGFEESMGLPSIAWYL